ncbi:penicillin-binding protein [Flavobacterium enshiense DK69]|uniref:Glycosyl transferase n=1 Tax=Flavobacterium enshiense DK69 TaxID=1107311 RepID=V6SBB1_9FLAO|nr:biosynthetic peptidoglycan transglycosylase [Flavobacterium enshiense]ESU23734.1 penicillin-binding protein [Flavobacterium enshiense DK69]KGO96137.1 glycosyl transferase [Flavobacterium enshiense DK69]
MALRSRKQKFFLFLKILAALLLLAMAGMYFFRDMLLQKAIAKVKSKFDSEYNCHFSVKKAAFIGATGVELHDIVLIPKEADTLLSVQNIKTSYNILELLTGDIQLKNLEMNNGFIQLVKNKNGRNFDAFLNGHKEEKSNEKRNYAKLVYRLLSKALNLVPTEMKLKNLSLRMDDMGRKVTLHMNDLRLEDHQLQTAINVKTNTFSQNWNIKGFANPREKKADLKFFNSDTSKIQLPYIDERFGLKSSFDNIHIKLDKLEMESGELHIDGFTSIENFTINHPKIAKKDVVIKNARFDYRFLLGRDFISIDSTSSAQLNHIKVHPFAEYNTEEDTIYKLKIRIPKMKAQDFITSLPQGLFTHFEGMEAEGNFDYKLNFEYNKKKPDNLIFDVKLNKENLRIVKYGEANLAKLNGEFTYRAIENDVEQRPILVGAGNPNYTPLDQISPYLEKAVLTNEDPSFRRHHGFINEAFKQSIVKNIRTKKFARGASTISMQLVKNVFLTREKTLSRKLEEILLVYVLENNRIATKSRMLEVYFNVIEWGPNVYGIGEAAHFYFQKSPSDLTLNECLYLASIVPKPKKFMWQFDDEGNQKSYAQKNQNYIKNLMLRRALITSEDTIGQSAPIYISGRARSFLKIKVVQDTIPAETNLADEFDF